jgi:hypothetical protein
MLRHAKMFVLGAGDAATGVGDAAGLSTAEEDSNG